MAAERDAMAAASRRRSRRWQLYLHGAGETDIGQGTVIVRQMLVFIVMIGGLISELRKFMVLWL